MKAVISTTYDDQYLYFLPITTWCWSKLGAEVICLMPYTQQNNKKESLAIGYIGDFCSLPFGRRYFFCHPDKQATYTQCSRLYAAALAEIADDERLVTSDIDMAVFKQPLPAASQDMLEVLGHDLTPQGQFPMCYVAGTAKTWREVMQINGRSLQQCLDDLLGAVECENMRGNYWSKDQEELYNKLTVCGRWTGVKRARPGTQFAADRVDRDDINWRTYCGPDLMDAHLWRPGYTDENFANILELLRTQYPDENFDWLINYRNEYLKLIQG